MKLETRSMKLETRSMKLETRNMKLETRTLKLETRSMKLETRNSNFSNTPNCFYPINFMAGTCKECTFSFLPVVSRAVKQRQLMTRLVRLMQKYIISYVSPSPVRAI